MSKLIIIDPGHGKSDPGAVGKSGTKEKDINLSVSLKVVNYLKLNGFNTKMTRDSDYVPWNSANINEDLRERVKIANNSNADAFISIHCNSVANSTAKGFEIYTTRGQNNSDILATKIHSRVKATFPNLTYREDWSDGDPDKEADFYVIKNTNMVSTLVELLFLSNPEEEKMLNDPIFQDKMAFAIAQGIGDYFGVSIKKDVNSLFKDIVNHWAKNDIAWLAERGIVKGKEVDKFYPEDLATRAEMSVIIKRSIDYILKELKG